MWVAFDVESNLLGPRTSVLHPNLVFLEKNTYEIDFLMFFFLFLFIRSWGYLSIRLYGQATAIRSGL